MKQIKTLTVNGNTYEIADPDAAHIDDSAVGTDAWSSRKISDAIGAAQRAIIHRLCPSFTESGSAIRCEPVEGYPLSVLSTINPTLDGVSSVKLYHGSKNILNIGGMLNNVLTKDGDKYKMGYFPGVGRQSADVDMFVPAGTTILFSADVLEDTTTDGVALQLYYEDGYNGNVAWLGKTMTLDPSHGNLIKVRFVCVAESSGNEAHVIFKNPQVEIGSTKTAYEPFRVEIITKDFGELVYGGLLDWNSGVLTINQRTKTFDGTENWELIGNTDNNYFNYRFHYGQSGLGAASYLTRVECSHYPYNSSVYGDSSDGIGVIVTGDNIYIRLGSASTITTVDAFKAFLAEQYAAGTPVQVCYQLATPITVQLTPTEILALSGQNTLYSDTGDTTVAGRADLPALLQSLTAAQ